MTKKMDIFLENKYSKIYFDIIERARDRHLENVYFESHHIIPLSLGGHDIAENMVDLTAREHFICHLLLVKAVRFEYKKKMNYAFWRMCNGSNNRYVPSSRLYKMGKEAFVNAQMGHEPYLLSHTVESRKKISRSMSEVLGKMTDKEMKDRMINSCCNPAVYTEERARNISKSKIGKKDSESARKNKSIAAQKRSNDHLIEMGKARKNKPWSENRRKAYENKRGK
jgi:hypothetical protein